MDERTRLLRNVCEPIGANVYFAPEAHQRYAALGLAEYGPAYFCSRGASLGKPSGLVVTSAFGVFSPAVVVSIDPVFDQKANAIWQLESQIESLWVKGDFERVVPIPKEPVAREARRVEEWERFGKRDTNTASLYRALLVKAYGEDKGRAVKHAEAFELCEYGRQPSTDELKQLFPFFGP